MYAASPSPLRHESSLGRDVLTARGASLQYPPPAPVSPQQLPYPPSSSPIQQRDLEALKATMSAIMALKDNAADSPVIQSRPLEVAPRLQPSTAIAAAERDDALKLLAVATSEFRSALLRNVSLQAEIDAARVQNSEVHALADTYRVTIESLESDLRRERLKGIEQKQKAEEDRRETENVRRQLSVVYQERLELAAKVAALERELRPQWCDPCSPKEELSAAGRLCVLS